MLPEREFRQNKRKIGITFVLGAITVIVIACSPRINITSTLTIPPTQTRFSKTIASKFYRTPSATLTARPTSTITITPTIDKIVALVSDFKVSILCLSNYRVSNDKNWIGADCPRSQELIIVNKSTGKKIILSYQEIEKDISSNFSIRPLSWSSDNRYLYFTTRCCEFNDSSSSNGELYRFDTENESWSIQVHVVDRPFYFFSNNGEHYIYLNYLSPEGSDFSEDIEICMVDVKTNKRKRIFLKYYRLSQYDTPEYTWSSDGNQFSLALEKITALYYDTLDFENAQLSIDFDHWAMELAK